jgi:hypothetical protein
MITIFLFIIGIAIWYALFVSELYINGCMNPKKYMFKELWNEFLWILPNGWIRRINYVKNERLSFDENIELAASLPGIWHFVILHIMIPFGPVLFWSFYGK